MPNPLRNCLGLEPNLASNCIQSLLALALEPNVEIQTPTGKGTQRPNGTKSEPNVRRYQRGLYRTYRIIVGFLLGSTLGPCLVLLGSCLVLRWVPGGLYVGFLLGSRWVPIGLLVDLRWVSGSPGFGPGSFLPVWLGFGSCLFSCLVSMRFWFGSPGLPSSGSPRFGPDTIIRIGCPS